MSRWRRPTLIVIAAVAFAVGALACGGDDSNPVSDETNAPGSPDALTITPGQPSATTGSQTPATGDPQLDAILVAVSNGDRATLAGLFQTESVACVERTTYGGPPQCNEAPGSPPVGTVVSAFYYRSIGSCEHSWAFDVAPLAGLLASQDLELYAVVGAGSPGALPNALDRYRAVFEFEAVGVSPRGLAVSIEGGRIVELDYLCFAPPSTALEHLGQGVRVLLYGPAYP